MRKEALKIFCETKLQSIEVILNTVENLTPVTKLRLFTKKNILKHLVDFETCFNFVSIDELAQYIEDRTDIICGFYE